MLLLPKSKIFRPQGSIRLSDVHVNDVNHGDLTILQTGGQTLMHTINHPHIRDVEIPTVAVKI